MEHYSTHGKVIQAGGSGVPILDHFFSAASASIFDHIEGQRVPALLLILYVVMVVPFHPVLTGFLSHGTNDCVVPITSSMNFAANLIRAIGRDKVQYRWIEGARYLKDDFETEENFQLIGDFLDKYMKD